MMELLMNEKPYSIIIVDTVALDIGLEDTHDLVQLQKKLFINKLLKWEVDIL